MGRSPAEVGCTPSFEEKPWGELFCKCRPKIPAGPMLAQMDRFCTTPDPPIQSNPIRDGWYSSSCGERRRRGPEKGEGSRARRGHALLLSSARGGGGGKDCANPPAKDLTRWSTSRSFGLAKCVYSSKMELIAQPCVCKTRNRQR